MLMIHLALLLGAWFVLSCVFGVWLGRQLKEISAETRTAEPVLLRSETGRRDLPLSLLAQSRGLHLVNLTD
jgi:hypothetical protein